MTVKEALSIIESPEEVSLTWNGSVVNFNFQNDIEVEVWGSYVVDKIAAMKDRGYEIILAAQPIRKGATA